MSIELKQAVEELKAAARPFHAMLALVDRLDAIGDIEQVESEARARLAGLKAQEGVLRHELDVANSGVANAKRKAADIIERAKHEAVEALDAAKAQAADIIERARAQAQSVRESAAQDASSARAEADAARAEAQAAEQQSRDLEDRLTAARAAIASLMQGAAG